MAYYLLTVESSHRSGFGLQVEPAVRIVELASRVKDLDVPVRGDMLWLLFPDGANWRAPLAEFGIDGWRDDENGLTYTHSSPTDPAFTLTIAGDKGPEDLPAGTEIWLDDVSPTGGHRTKGWRHIIEQLSRERWILADPGEPPTPPPDPA